MPKKRGVIYINEDTKWELLEAVFKLPPEQREEFLLKALKDKKAVYLGSTTKSAPELASECIKRGIKAKSYIHGGENHAKRSS